MDQFKCLKLSCLFWGIRGTNHSIFSRAYQCGVSWVASKHLELTLLVCYLVSLLSLAEGDLLYAGSISLMFAPPSRLCSPACTSSRKDVEGKPFGEHCVEETASIGAPAPLACGLATKPLRGEQWQRISTTFFLFPLPCIQDPLIKMMVKSVLGVFVKHVNVSACSFSNIEEFFHCFFQVYTFI